MRRPLPVLALAIAVVVPACGGGARTADAGAKVRIEGFRFLPKQIEVRAGSTVTWRKVDETAHTVTSGTPGRPTSQFDGRLAKSGQTFAVDFGEPGKAAYFCRIHPFMRGVVVVE